jgi:hypothetical protein
MISQKSSRPIALLYQTFGSHWYTCIFVCNEEATKRELLGVHMYYELLPRILALIFCTVRMMSCCLNLATHLIFCSCYRSVLGVFFPCPKKKSEFEAVMLLLALLPLPTNVQAEEFGRLIG